MFEADMDLRRRLVFAIISAILTFAAARAALYITNKIMGEPADTAL